MSVGAFDKISVSGVISSHDTLMPWNTELSLRPQSWLQRCPDETAPDLRLLFIPAHFLLDGI